MNFTLHNMMSARGFDGGMSGEFFMAWIGLAILVLIGMFAKKWLGEEEIVGIPYNWIGSLLGVVVYILIVTVSGSAKIALVGGLIGAAVGGFGGATFMGGSEE